MIAFDWQRGLYIVLRHAKGDRRAIGLKIKRKSAMLYSERNGLARGITIGPIYIGTYGAMTKIAQKNRGGADASAVTSTQINHLNGR